MPQQSQTWAVQESGTENHSGLKEPLVGIFRQKTQTACNVLIIFKTKHVAKNARGLTAFQRLGGTKLSSFNRAVSINHHLYRERNMKGNYSNISGNVAVPWNM